MNDDGGGLFIIGGLLLLAWWLTHRSGGTPTSAGYSIAGDDTGQFSGAILGPTFGPGSAGVTTGGCCC